MRRNPVRVTTYAIGDDQGRGYSLCAYHRVEPNTSLMLDDDDWNPVELGDVIAEGPGHCHHPACSEPPEDE